MEETTQPNLFELHVDDQSTGYLGEAAKWTKFLAIIGFIVCALIVLAALFISFFAGALLNSFTSGLGGIGGAMIGVVYIAIGLLYFFPCLYLFKFSTRMQTALRNHDQVSLIESFKNLKSCFKYMGILTIIVLSIYVLALLVGLFGVAASH